MLEEYNRKRKFDSTPEPFGRTRGERGQSYVIQKHKASRLHYDFRLEMDGVLRSWAIPKGPSPDPQEKRLAVETEDHPVDYGGFEGVIPKGNYGAGQVIIWDRGTYEMVDPSTPEKGWEKRKFHLVLKGEKLGGGWILVKTSRGDKEWLFFKVQDAFSSGTDITATRPESVVSGAIVEEIGAPGTSPRRWDVGLERELERLGVKKAGRVPLPDRVSPMMATPAGRIVEGRDWLYEIKLDGIRAIASKQGPAVDIRSRNEKPLNERFPGLVRAVAGLGADAAILDGEIVAFDEEGRSRFGLLQKAAAPAYYSVFDLLHINGYDLTAQPLTARKAVLRKLIPENGWIRYTDHVEGNGREFFEAAASHGLEGVVAKKTISAYHQRRSPEWVKVKTARADDFVVLGFTPPAGTRRHLGALVLGQYDPDGKLVYVGRAGSGFDAKSLREAHAALEPLTRKTPLIRPVPKEISGARWVRPALVAEVRFSEWTPDRKLRAPVFLRFRDDKEPSDCVLGPDISEASLLETLPDAKPAKSSRLELTNPDKIFWPGEGITKGDLVRYYADIEATLAPYLEGRPLVLKRYPDGITGEHFYQKDAPDHIPDWVRTEVMWSEDSQRDIRYFVGCDRGLLPFLANLGGITQNPWSSRIGHLDHPDYAIFDLDPADGVPYGDVRKVALELRKVLGELELRGYPKTSGASGLHVYLPLLEDRFTYRDLRIFAEAIASIVVRRVPELATIERSVSRRPKAVYVDFLQNVKGKPVASVYSPRARPGAPVSAPLRWEELERAVDPGKYTIRTIFRRLGRVGDLFAPVLEDRQDIGPFLEALREPEGR
jgi:bifunctional non-homologous end joining protein LigD